MMLALEAASAEITIQEHNSICTKNYLIELNALDGTILKKVKK